MNCSDPPLRWLFSAYLSVNKVAKSPRRTSEDRALQKISNQGEWFAQCQREATRELLQGFVEEKKKYLRCGPSSQVLCGKDEWSKSSSPITERSFTGPLPKALTPTERKANCHFCHVRRIIFWRAISQTEVTQASLWSDLINKSTNKDRKQEYHGLCQNLMAFHTLQKQPCLNVASISVSFFFLWKQKNEEWLDHLSCSCPSIFKASQHV